MWIKHIAKKSTWQFYIKKCLFGAINIVKNSNKDKWIYSNCGEAFGGKVLWIFGNVFARNVVTFGVDNSLSSHSDNLSF